MNSSRDLPDSTVITDREDIDSAGYRVTGRSETPRQCCGVGPNVPGPVLFEHEGRRDAIEKLLSLVA
jgi:hypothetical protein